MYKPFFIILFLALTNLYSTEAPPVDEVFSKFINGLPPQEKQKFSDIDRIKKGNVLLFDQNLAIRFYKKGLLMAHEGKVEMLILQNPPPRQNSGSTINRIYKNQKGKKTLRKPMEGPYSVFDSKYRYHVYDKGIIIFKPNPKKNLHMTVITDEVFKP